MVYDLITKKYFVKIDRKNFTKNFQIKENIIFFKHYKKIIESFFLKLNFKGFFLFI